MLVFIFPILNLNELLDVGNMKLKITFFLVSQRGDCFFNFW